MIARLSRAVPALAPMPSLWEAVALSTATGVAPLQLPLESHAGDAADEVVYSMQQGLWPFKNRQEKKQSVSHYFVDFRELSCQGIVDMFNRLGPNVAGQHLGAAFSRLKKMDERPPMSMLDDLAQLTMQVGTTKLNARDSVSILSSCSRMGYFNLDLFNFLGEHILKHQDFISMREVGDLIYGLTLLRKDWVKARKPNRGSPNRPLFSDEDEAMFPAEKDLVNCAISRIAYRRFSASHDSSSLTSIVWGLGQLGCGNERVCMELAKTVGSRRTLQYLMPRDLATALLGFARLQYRGKVTDTLAQEALQYLSRFNEVELANIVYALGQVKYTNKPVLDTIVGEITRPERLFMCTSQGLAAILHGLANCRFNNWDLTEALGRESVRPARLTTSSPQDLTMYIYSLGKMEFSDGGILQALLSEIVKPARLSRFSPHGLANILYGMAKSGFYPPSLVQPLAREICCSDRLQGFSEQGLSNILYSLGLMQFQDLAMLHQIVTEVVCPKRLQHLTNQGICNILYGLSQTDFRDKVLLAPLIKEAVNEQRVPHYTEQGLLNLMFACGNFGSLQPVGELLKEIEKRGKKVNTRGKVGILFSLGKLNYRDEGVVSKLLTQLMSMETLRSMRAKQICQVLHAMANLEYRDMDAVAVFANEAITPHRLSDFFERSFTLAVHSLGTLGYRDMRMWGLLAHEGARRASLWDPQEMATALVGYARGSVRSLLVWEASTRAMKAEGWLDNCTVSDAARIAWAFGKAGFYEETALRSLVHKFVCTHNWTKDTLHEATSMLFACGVHDHCSDILISYVLGNLLRQAPEATNLSEFCDPQALATTVWYMAVVGRLHARTFLQLCERVVQLEKRGHTLASEDLNQLFLGHQCVRLHAVEHEGSSLEDQDTALQSSEVSALLLRAGEGYLQHISSQSVPSELQNEVLQTLNRLGISHAPNVLLKEAYFVADAALLDERTVVEADGSVHFTCNKPAGQYRLLGSTVLRNRLLVLQGWKVVSVPFFAWEHLDERGQEGFLLKALRDNLPGT
ncbi:unnamed protein product [Ostreobium quekettii]|uniref:RAP domain-containing protein n=1 Tax=Ostreobium quekettii TaxID=121088 RepID=A0A8S1J151_9CHLO|nr:unnamed protein product [Ostreobium quekettii]|eukprot:evm.model.scf_169EXC.6 EVM.evm.TU.scf_169EXC.6   scf_169EXC:90395-94324(+)